MATFLRFGAAALVAGILAVSCGVETRSSTTDVYECCETHDEAFCHCGWRSSEDEACDGDKPLATCDPALVGGPTPHCCVSESDQVEGKYDCSCFGGHFTGGPCADDDASGVFTGAADDCTNAPDGPGYDDRGL